MPFKKGQSGNPEGRRKKTEGEREVETLAREHGPDAIKRLVHWMESDNPKASVAAATTMLNRGYGMPKQNIQATVKTTRYVIEVPASVPTEEWEKRFQPTVQH